MSDFILFWLAKPLVDAMIVVIFVIVVMLVQIPGAIRRGRCKHTNGVHETSACDAICNDCGKNLGFIGRWREQGKKG